MGRLIRLDRSGHTTLAEWTAGEAHRRAAVAAFRRELELGHRRLGEPSRRHRRGGSRVAARRRAGGPAAADRRRLSAGRVEAARRRRPPRRGGAPALARRRQRDVRCGATAGAGPPGRRGSWSRSSRRALCCSRSSRSPSRPRRSASRTPGRSRGSRRGAAPARWCRSAASAARRGGPAAEPGAERVALGLLGDLVGHDERDLLAETGLALQCGALGAWLVGEQGAFLVAAAAAGSTAGAYGWARSAGLPAGDRVAHLLLALREDELGFAKVANLGFSGALWRVRAQLPEVELGRRSTGPPRSLRPRGVTPRGRALARSGA